MSSPPNNQDSEESALVSEPWPDNNADGDQYRGQKASWTLDGMTESGRWPRSVPSWCFNAVGGGTGDRASRIAMLKKGHRGIAWSKTIRGWTHRGQTGWPLEWRPVWRQPGRVVILWDVSGSMEPYIPLYLPWVYQWASVRGAGIFAFGTRINDFTDQMSLPFFQVAGILAKRLDVFGTGTSIGENLLLFLTDWGDRWLSSSTTVIVVSDGWDVGSPEILGQAMVRLRQRIRRLFWIHPLMATPGFEPKTRALKVALRYVDAMFPGEDAMALMRLKERLQ